MIQGFKLTVNGSELKEIFERRVSEYAKKVEEYQVKVKAVTDAMGVAAQAVMDAGFSKNSSYSPQDAIEQKLNTTRDKVSYFKFLAAHVDLKETFLLDEDEVRKYEIARFQG